MKIAIDYIFCIFYLNFVFFSYLFSKYLTKSQQYQTNPQFAKRNEWMLARDIGFLIIAWKLKDMLGPDQAYEGLYGQGPPSVHSSHGGRAFQQGMYL